MAPNYCDTLKSKETVGAQAATAIWTPATGKRIILHSATLTTLGAAAACLHAGSPAGDTNRIINGDWDNKGGEGKTFNKPLRLPVNVGIYLTSDASNQKVTLIGREE